MTCGHSPIYDIPIFVKKADRAWNGFKQMQ